MDWYIKESNKRKQKTPAMKFNRKYYRYIKTMDINMKKIGILDEFLKKKISKLNVKKKSKDEGGLFITSTDPDSQPSHKKKDKKKKDSSVLVIKKQNTLATAKRLTEIMNKYTLPIMPKFSLFQNNSDDKVIKLILRAAFLEKKELEQLENSMNQVEALKPTEEVDEESSVEE